MTPQLPQLSAGLSRHPAMAAATRRHAPAPSLLAPLLPAAAVLAGLPAAPHGFVVILAPAWCQLPAGQHNFRHKYTPAPRRRDTARNHKLLHDAILGAPRGQNFQSSKSALFVVVWKFQKRPTAGLKYFKEGPRGRKRVLHATHTPPPNMPNAVRRSTHILREHTYHQGALTEWYVAALFAVSCRCCQRAAALVPVLPPHLI